MRYGQTKEYHRNHKFLKRYGITTDDYEFMKSQQQNKCLICERDDRKLVVDHCHSSGRVRGLLCNQCNAVIGYSFENEDILLKVVAYLRRYQEECRAYGTDMCDSEASFGPE